MGTALGATLPFLGEKLSSPLCQASSDTDSVVTQQHLLGTVVCFLVSAAFNSLAVSQENQLHCGWFFRCFFSWSITSSYWYNWCVGALSSLASMMHVESRRTLLGVAPVSVQAWVSMFTPHPAPSSHHIQGCAKAQRQWCVKVQVRVTLLSPAPTPATPTTPPHPYFRIKRACKHESTWFFPPAAPTHPPHTCMKRAQQWQPIVTKCMANSLLKHRQGRIF